MLLQQALHYEGGNVDGYIDLYKISFLDVLGSPYLHATLELHKVGLLYAYQIVLFLLTADKPCHLPQVVFLHVDFMLTNTDKHQVLPRVYLERYEAVFECL